MIVMAVPLCSNGAGIVNAAQRVSNRIDQAPLRVDVKCGDFSGLDERGFHSLLVECVSDVGE